MIAPNQSLVLGSAKIQAVITKGEEQSTLKERVVLGIDAAWTSKNPSGIALIKECGQTWTLVKVASSVPEFLELAPSQSNELPVGALLAASADIAGFQPDVIAVDMPLASVPIVGRRFSDNEVSRKYGGRKCGTHTPNSERPGVVGKRLSEGFEQAGYPLRTTTFEGPGLVEVYPHPALVELAGARERLPYKASKVRAYWPDLSLEERRIRLMATWGEIIDLLDKVIVGTGEMIEPMLVSRKLKSIEDALDAVICAWVGSCILDGTAVPFGDADSAIWIPERRAI